jgi:hypothetical protein
MICPGLLATSAAVAACGALAWLVSGSETLLAAGLGGGVLLGLAEGVAIVAPDRPGGQAAAECSGMMASGEDAGDDLGGFEAGEAQVDSLVADDQALVIDA